MRLWCLIVLTCFALSADARPFRRCSGGRCAVPSPTVAVQPFQAKDTAMAPQAAPASQTVTVQAQSCANGQCAVSRMRRR